MFTSHTCVREEGRGREREREGGREREWVSQGASMLCWCMLLYIYTLTLVMMLLSSHTILLQLTTVEPCISPLPFSAKVSAPLLLTPEQAILYWSTSTAASLYTPLKEVAHITNTCCTLAQYVHVNTTELKERDICIDDTSTPGCRLGVGPV